MRSGCRACIVVVVAVLGIAAPVRAQVPPAPEPVRPAFDRSRLTYDRSAGGPTCPEESFFRAVVASHLGGHDPFTPDAGPLVVLTIRRERGAFVAVVRYIGKDGTQEGIRPPVRERTCTSLVDTMGTIVALALIRYDDPPPPVKPAEPPPPAAKPAEPLPPAAKPAEPSPPPAKPAEPPPRLPVVVELGPHVSFATLPGTAFGLAGAVGLRWAMFSLALELSADLPRSTDPWPKGWHVRESLILGSVVPCLHAGGWFIGCGLVSGGVFVNEGIGTPFAVPDTPYVGAGARLGAEVPLAPRFAPHLVLRVVGDVRGLFVQQPVKLSGRDAWTPPSAGGAVGVRLATTF